jgi:hypothetical protein
MSMKMNGMDRVLQNLHRAGENVKDVTAQGMVELAEKILERATSRDLIPWLSGDMARSGKVKVVDRDVFSGRFQRAVAEITFSQLSPNGYPYPVRQHEDFSLNHPNGGGPKFLEKAMDEFANAKGLRLVCAIVQGRIKGTVSR